MKQKKGSEILGELHHNLQAALDRQTDNLYSPGKRKSDKPLRRFTIREMADICLRMNYSTLRHYIKTIEGLPDGIIESGNRRTYSLEEVHEIQKILYEAGKIPNALYPGKLGNDETTVLLTFNLKGGAGKSVTCCNIATVLASRGFKVLLIDLDPQSSSSDLFDVKADKYGLPSIYDVLRFKNREDDPSPIPIEDAIQATYFPNLDIVPGSITFSEFEYEAVVAARSGTPFYTRIADAIQPVKEHYDVVLMDSPPALGFSIVSALHASNAILVPISAGMLDVVSLVKFLELATGTLSTIEEQDDSQGFDFIKLLLTRYSPSDSAQMQLSSFLRSTLRDAMLDSSFLQSTAIHDAGNTMEPLLEIDPSNFTRKTYDRILESILGISREIEEQIMISRGRLDPKEEST